MKGICRIAGIVALAAFLLTVPAYAAIPQAYGDEEAIWSYLSELCPNDQIAAGIMGFYFRESRLRADAVAGWNDRADGVCEEFVKAADDGMPKAEFIEQVRNFGGYGLGQWVAQSYLGSLYDYMEEHDCSIGDARGQCEFTVQSMMENELLWSEMQECRTAAQCGRRIGRLYDGTSEEGCEAIAAFAEYYYERMRT